MSGRIACFSLLVFTLGLMACGGESGAEEGTDSLPGSLQANGEVTAPACELLEELGDCGACYTAETTCTYGAYSATESSCQQCQAMAALFQLLCSSGNTDNRESIEEEMVCTDAAT